MRMGTLVQIRDVPDEVHRELKARAARDGVSLSEYLRKQLERVAESPTPQELIDRLQSRRPVDSPETSARALRATRDQRG